ncbi:unnamed protein product [Euphydryas editha]|uniref:Uncharacterized protein n=1 Tax=Euphydryas editha TaxID=104508 RepID=A0AAU9TFN4_EUPED|nr:unnamed protein product [Euphydryas editha]
MGWRPISGGGSAHGREGSSAARLTEVSLGSRNSVAPWGSKVEDEGGALLGRLQGALRGGAAAASPSRVASSIKGYLTNKVGSLQLKDTGKSKRMIYLQLCTEHYSFKERSYDIKRSMKVRLS